jgi:murein DD-endopeptidase MepM/ murein hydrolase activator NlpD
MKRILLGFALALVSVAGTASADTFRVLPTAPANLPSAAVPNQPGQISAPEPISAPPAVPQALNFPQLVALWQGAGSAYGIPWQVLASINKIESNFGRNMGPSSAGAVGWMQFMPSTWERWGVDANGDGVADPWNPQDAIYAASRYLAASGGAQDLPRAVLSYNHAQWYVDEVLQLAHTFGSGGADTTFTLDRLQVSLDGARADVAKANRELVAALKVQRGWAKRERRVQARADGVQLLSKQLELQKEATQVGVREHQAEVRVAELRGRLTEATAALTKARTQAQSAASAPAAVAGALFASPVSNDSGYVFPVGGGPSIVSVSHHHHDYPAADIAAPEGAPVYALSDAVVLRSWSQPDPRCGIGLTLRAGDGQEWTYCHLSYLDPQVTPGAVLTAGQLVGLVGQTGDATGPHLHLQLDPATQYPQLEPWFERFAGTAFRWQDAATPSLGAGASGSTPVFAQVAGGNAAPGGVIRFKRIPR